MAEGNPERQKNNLKVVMHLLDSNIIIYSADIRYSFLRSYFTDSQGLLASISVIEVLGFNKLNPTDKKYFEAVFKIIPVIPLTDAVIQEAVLIRQTHNISVADSIIAATSIMTDATLMTRNVEDFRNIKRLKLINPLEK